MSANRASPGEGVDTLFPAVRNNDIETVRSLANDRVDMQALDVHGEGCLSIAARRGLSDMVSVLLDYIPVDQKSKNGDTALMNATCEDVVCTLIQAGANVNVFNRHQETPLMRAVRTGAGLTVISALLNAGANPNSGNDEGFTAIMHAVTLNDDAVLKLLMERSPDLERLDRGTGETALGKAFSYGSMDAAKLLIEKGANINTRDSRGFSSLLRAISEHATSMAHLALDSGASPSAPNNAGETPLMLAAAMGMASIVERLLAMGVDTAAVCNSAQTAAELGTEHCAGLIRAHEQAISLEGGSPTSQHVKSRRI